MNTQDEFREAAAALQSPADTAQAKARPGANHKTLARPVLRDPARAGGSQRGNHRYRRSDAAELYAELRARHSFQLAPAQLKVALNAEFSDWHGALKHGDTVVFIPPVAGG